MDPFINGIKNLIKPPYVEKCNKCNYTCNAKRFQQSFENWTSGNNDIDEFIQDTQLSMHNNNEVSANAIEWIPYDRLDDIAKNKFGKVYKANWIDGKIENWDNENKNWTRYGSKDVILKRLNNSKNIIIEFTNEINMPLGITQDPETKNYMMVLNNTICKKCNYACYAIHFQQNFGNWTSGNNDIDKFIQDTQQSMHNSNEVSAKAIEWIPYDRLDDITKNKFEKLYKANWIDGKIEYWDNENRNWIRYGSEDVILKSLNNSNNIAIEFTNEIRKLYGITQDPQTKNYMMILNNKCKKCNSRMCNAIHFEHKFMDWTSSNDYLDKFIQDTQLSSHKDLKEVLEWIPYNRLYDIKYIVKNKFGRKYRANWIDGNINYWDEKSQNWKRINCDMFVTLISLDNLKNLTFEFTNKIKIKCEFYGITQDPETKNYLMVMNNKCKKCNSRMCNTLHFQYNFIDWTSGNSDIDKFIQDTQLSSHKDVKEVLEWIPYNRLYNIKYIAENEFGKVYRANWIDGNISYCNDSYWDKSSWNDENQNWKREGHNMLVNLKSLNNSKNITIEFIDEVNKPHGITQDPETKNYMMVLNINMCKKCNFTCNAIYFQQNFENWTSGNDDIDKFIQVTQLSSHRDVKEVLEWIPYDRLYNIKCIVKDKFGKTYRANWIDGNISYWDNENQNWKRKGHNMFVNLKNLNNSKNITIEFLDEINKPHGITQDPETKNYMMVLNITMCKKCNFACNAIHFQQNFENWTSGNDDIDKFIQDNQLSMHNNNEVFTNAIEWIPYNAFYDIEYIARGGFGKVYKANWIDGCMVNWNSVNRSLERYNENMFVALKSLDNSKNVALKFMNEIMLHNKVKMDNNVIVRFYGITQEPKMKDYMMVLEYAEDGSLRNYLDKEYNNLSNWNKIFEYLQNIIVGLKCIHEKELIHRDLHIGNVLKFKYKTAITDMGLCKPANYNTVNTKNSIYGVLPYIAPEILRGQNYTKATDIYSFGIIMYELISGFPPYHDTSHDNYLAIKICKGLRPRFNIKVPQLIVHLIKRCLDADPLNRPVAKEIIDILFRWQYESNNNQTIELQLQIREADKVNNNSSANSSITSSNLGISYNTHSDATYTSRLLDFNNLPKPKNSDDYYEQIDNIISEKFSESLQIDISQLDINYANNDCLIESLQIDISQLDIN
ncbi:hypothetical protein C1646_762276 [Rhizophagus diaphanus]|nr:hypothetical protein C1646_762276 [Rhizophagus diaphanus] [Rhizophagus sp. MUCL 43196]